MVSVKAALPAVALVGYRLLVVGAGRLMVKVEVAEVPLAVVTVMLTIPAVAIRPEVTAAVICEELMQVALKDVLPHLTVAPDVKFAPPMVSVKAAPPAVAEFGLRLEIVGAGRLTVKVEGPEFPLAVDTVMPVVPEVAISAAGTIAVNCVQLT
jgi:hypothetical protein